MGDYYLISTLLKDLEQQGIPSTLLDPIQEYNEEFNEQ